MPKGDITLGFVLEKHRKNPKDKKLHQKIEKGRIRRNVLLGYLRNLIKR